MNPLNEIYEKDFGNWFVPQPFGSQSFPDFIICFKGTIIPVELKSNKGINGTPFWNGHIPTQTGIYLVTDGKPSAELFLGKDYISPEETKKLLAIKNRVIAALSLESQKDLPMNFRVRSAFDSNQKSPFLHPKRKERRSRVEKFLSSL